jgi:PIN domain nuclease of toxin-antitoxin system
MILTRRSKPLPIIAHEGAARCSCAAVVSGQQHQLSAKALACIQDAANTIFVSPATLWEIGIKDSLGKLSPSTSSFPTDPFDRLVIAQALVEDLTLVSCDAEFAAYGMKLLW